MGAKITDEAVLYDGGSQGVIAEKTCLRMRSLANDLMDRRPTMT
jgi:hypothetical protein